MFGGGGVYLFKNPAPGHTNIKIFMGWFYMNKDRLKEIEDGMRLETEKYNFPSYPNKKKKKNKKM